MRLSKTAAYQSPINTGENYVPARFQGRCLQLRFPTRTIDRISVAIIVVAIGAGVALRMGRRAARTESSPTINEVTRTEADLAS